MGKDQRSKKHGLDVRKNRKLKALRQQAFQPPQPPPTHRGQQR